MNKVFNSIASVAVSEVIKTGKMNKEAEALGVKIVDNVVIYEDTAKHINIAVDRGAKTEYDFLYKGAVSHEVNNKWLLKRLNNKQLDAYLDGKDFEQNFSFEGFDYNVVMKDSKLTVTTTTQVFVTVRM